MNQIWTLTLNPAIDIEGEVGNLEPDVKLRSKTSLVQAGGGGVNVARVLRRLGMEATAVFPCGGPLGTYFRELLEKEDVDCETVAIEDEPRINTHIRSGEENRQYRFVMPGAELDEEEADRVLERVSELVGEGDWLICSGSLPPGVEPAFVRNLAEKVAKAEARLILDAPGKVIREAKDLPASWLKPNLRELEDALGEEVEMEQIGKALDALREMTGADNILLSLGKEGAVYRGVEGDFRVPAPDVEKVSSVGAGDSALAGLAFALAKGRSVREAVEWAMAAGAAAVMTPGTHLLRVEDFMKLIEDDAEE